MNREFVPYELALKLKELGFDEECFGCYIYHGKRKGNLLTWTIYESILKQGIKAPLWQQTFDWLFQEFSVSLCILNSLSYKDKVKILDNEIRNIQNNKSQK